MTTQQTDGTQATGYTVDVAKKLMQDYEAGSSFGSALIGSLSPVRTKDNKLFIGFVTAESTFYAVSRSADSTTGWIMQTQTWNAQIDYCGPITLNGQSVIAVILDNQGRDIYTIGFDADGKIEAPDQVGSLWFAAYPIPGWSPTMSMFLNCCAGSNQATMWGYSLTDQKAYPTGFTENGNWVDIPNSPVFCALPLPASSQFPAYAIAYGSGLAVFVGDSVYDGPPNDVKAIKGSLTSLPQIDGVVQVCALATGVNSIQCFAIDGSNKVYSLSGTCNPADGTIGWANSWSVSFFPGSGLAFSFMEGVVDSQGIAHFLLMEGAGQPSGSLWLLHLDLASGGWSSPVEAWPVPVSDFAFCGSPDGVDFCFITPDNKFYYMLLDAQGESSVEEIEIEGDAEMADKATYRIGVTIAATDGGNVSGIGVAIGSDDSFPITVNGNRRFVSAGKTIAAETDQDGCIWMTVDVVNSISSPTIILTSAVFEGGSLEIQADADAEAYLTAVTPQNLLDGQDPRTNTPLLNTAHHDEQDAESICSAIQKIAKTSTAIRYSYASAEPPATIRLVPRPGVYWRGKPVAGAGVTAGARVSSGAGLYSGARVSSKALLESLPDPNWRFRLVDGRPKFEVLTSEEAAAVIAGLKALPAFQPPGPGGLKPGGLKPGGLKPGGLKPGGLKPEGWFDDAWDFVESAWDSVVEGISSVAEIIVTGADAFVTFVINGVSQVLQIALDSVRAVLNLCNGIFDIIGTVLGTVLGWLMDIIGWLFGWPRILAARDNIKALVKQTIGSLPNTIADPSTLVQGWINTLEGFRGKAQGLLGTFEGSAQGSEPVSQYTLGLPPGISWMASAGALPQSTWLMDKLKEAIPKFPNTFPNPTIPGLQTLWDQLGKIMPDLKATFSGLLNGLLPTIQDLITNPQNLGKASLGPIMAIIGQFIDGLITTLEGLLKGLADILHLVWQNAASLAGWFDSEIYLPFLSAFYSKIVKSDLSVLDVVCLVAAIVAVATNVDENLAAAAMAGTAMAGTAMAGAALSNVDLATIFYGINCLTSALASFVKFMIDPDDMPFPASVLASSVDKIVGIITLSLILAGTSGQVWQGVAGSQLGVLVLSSFGVFTEYSWALDVVLGGLQIIADVICIAEDFAGGAVVYTVLDAMQMGLTWTVDAVRAMHDERMTWKRSLPAAILYGIAQGGLTGAKLGCWRATVSGDDRRPALMLRPVVAGV
jgi:hypothetical protein